MSFSEEQFIGKLNGLDETQESIVGASKWLLTLYKEAPVVAQSWAKYILMTSTNTRRKLLAIYLVNDVIQQAKHKRIFQFGNEFGRVLPNVLKQVFPELPQELQKKVQRVVAIWRQRQILSDNVLNNIERYLQGTGAGTTVAVGTINSRIDEACGLYRTLEKYAPNVKSTQLKFEKSLEALDPNSMVYVENFKTVTKIATAAKETVHKSVELRQKLIEQLEVLVAEQKTLLANELHIVSEVDVQLASKDPSAVQGTSAGDDNVLPTYEQELDSDNSSDDSDDESNLKKRSPHDDSDSQSKRPKLSRDEDMGGGYEPAVVAGTDASRTPEDQNSITSSIQDLLSKLAN
ncbi:AAL081Cp [Eremothecium gossypii ATCC 10895]|uniref:AAL081Cp n=1 Tax=Eremothecium gossypii (strain ATCC 10895 / CBS 109.51 / FGSC 9923 / NRRL Y-1056) TaxID=284811 RepID=Q75F09_EREGS|nr:AAL081Cp [Eremothecium gossypii ATCC 10895]AAS50285.1 AAL081Cp [Eremothecium gossypii ATCC 10895]AEY94571.1 FAAL081Cp [Eremothecium gossypii FDAG1]